MNFIKKSLLLSALTLGFSFPAVAVEGHAGADVSLSDETGRLGVYSLRESSVEVTNIGANLFFNEPGDVYLSIEGSVLRKGLGGNENLEAGIAGRLFYTAVGENKINAESASGLMLGAEARYWLPADVPLAVSGNFLYAPKIVSFGDADDSTETNIRAEMRILPSAMAYAGFRRLVMTYPGIDYELDNNIHIGVKVAFQ